MLCYAMLYYTILYYTILYYSRLRRGAGSLRCDGESGVCEEDTLVITILYTTTTTQRGWCIEAFVSILATVAVSKITSRGWWCIESLFPHSGRVQAADRHSEAAIAYYRGSPIMSDEEYTARRLSARPSRPYHACVRASIHAYWQEWVWEPHRAPPSPLRRFIKVAYLFDMW